MARAKSASVLGTSAFGGFNMVPSLRPLETLHNKLTMRDMDLFFGRVTTTKFTPVSSPPYGSSSNTPVVSPRPPTFIKGTGISLPSSSNSSAGPSSPTSGSTPVDLVSQLRLYIKEIDSGQSESLTGQSETNQSNESAENKLDKSNQVTPESESGKSGEYTGNRFKVSQTETGTINVRSENNTKSDKVKSESLKTTLNTKSKTKDVESTVTNERSDVLRSDGTDKSEENKTTTVNK